MPKLHPKEFRDDVVAVARRGDAPLVQVAKDFGISDSLPAYGTVNGATVARLMRGDRRPVAYIAEAIGQSPVTVTQRVREARGMDLLTRVEPGRAGGRLTPRAEALLATLFTDDHDERED